MIARCENPREPCYPNYGGRGIRICERWRARFAAFLSDMGERPMGHSIERINNEGDYEPGNCRWATTAEQARNNRRNVRITHDGETLCVQDWAKRTGIDRRTLLWRLRNGVPQEELFQPGSLKRQCANCNQFVDDGPCKRCGYASSAPKEPR
jgi:hypothetical protein